VFFSSILDMCGTLVSDSANGDHDS
jgi:hypothetical protein